MSQHASTDAPTAEEAVMVSRRGVLFASSVGNFVEWFDFTLFGFTAAVLAKVFFPPGNEVASLLGAFAVYGVAFVARPVGAYVFGHIGDRRGRRTSLGLSIIIMGAATAAIGILPGWSQIGPLAPALLLLCRLAQGFSAGGEYTGALTFSLEHAPDNRRAWYLGLVGASTWLGAVGATMTVVIFQTASGPAFASGAWRWPFIIGGLIAVVGLFLRLRVGETPVFTDVQATTEKTKRPFRELVRGYWRTLLLLFAYFAVLGVLTHMFLGYMPTYLQKATGMSATTVLTLTTALNIVSIPVGLGLAVLADRYGRRPLIRIGASSAVIVVVPAYLLIGTANVFAIVLAADRRLALDGRSGSAGDVSGQRAV
ncbi:MFS transporter [Saccharopolyspora spinosa]|uniref:MFS transporter n=1 Tax=Saccharopolyspora spinosa TaxID=60894 RepID=UPI0002378F29|nr:MFS transporter [Saccharopolyspora spinosa]